MKAGEVHVLRVSAWNTLWVGLEFGFEMSITHQVMVISEFHSSKFMSSKPRQLMKSALVNGVAERQPGCPFSLT